MVMTFLPGRAKGTRLKIPSNVTRGSMAWLEFLRKCCPSELSENLSNSFLIKSPGIFKLKLEAKGSKWRLAFSVFRVHFRLSVEKEAQNFNQQKGRRCLDSSYSYSSRVEKQFQKPDQTGTNYKWICAGYIQPRSTTWYFRSDFCFSHYYVQ